MGANEVGCSACAYGSHMWTPKTAILTNHPTMIKANTMYPIDVALSWERAVFSKLPVAA